ncbi:MAG TPA: aldehyde dehydrogenase iron-sulfur subunit PaoA [Noviherbaspirillum sp.]|nr:aldehyde dehydrogenase iron-sulfur subunit PaoA [Noviherbaspirillum sp.]
MTEFDPSRRKLLKATAAATGGAVIAGRLAPEAEAANPQPAQSTPPPTVSVFLRVNGTEHQLMIDPRTTLLDALRERLHLTGSKKGCDQGQCGACTVIVDGRRITSCLTLAVMQEGHDITTIEGLGTPMNLHPMQAAFIKHDGYQCGFCTPGQICSAVAMLDEVKAGVPSHATADLTRKPEMTAVEFRERMSGNICRCGAYSNIQEAIAEVAGVKA